MNNSIEKFLYRNRIVEWNFRSDKRNLKKKTARENDLIRAKEPSCRLPSRSRNPLQVVLGDLSNARTAAVVVVRITVHCQEHLLNRHRWEDTWRGRERDETFRRYFLDNEENAREKEEEMNQI